LTCLKVALVLCEGALPSDSLGGLPSRERRSVSRALLPLPLRVSGKRTPSVSPTGSLWREMLHFQRQWVTYSFISLRIPSYVALPRKGVKVGSPSTDPTGTENLYTLGCGSVPQGDRLRHCCYYPMPCSLQHDTFHLGLGSPERR
jgi:hypothetical protein